VATNREKYESLTGARGPSLPFALAQAFSNIGVSEDDLWKLTEPRYGHLLRLAAAGLALVEQATGDSNRVLSAIDRTAGT
jgi:hypothetical protein